jgi:hypothetical protein
MKLCFEVCGESNKDSGNHVVLPFLNWQAYIENHMTAWDITTKYRKDVKHAVTASLGSVPSKSSLTHSVALQPWRAQAAVNTVS